MRTRLVLLCLAVAAVAVPHGAGAAVTERREQLTYSLNTTEQSAVAADEDRVTVTADDTVSSVVSVRLTVTAPDGTVSQVEGCNQVTTPVASRSQLQVQVRSGSCGSGQIALATRGSLALSFHKRPKPVSHVASPANRWAVLVGIQDYAGNTHSTIGGDGDVDTVRAALLSSGWASSHILVLKDQQATADGIRRATSWLVGHSSPSTFTLMHYSGHVCIASRGPCASGHTYLWGYDNRFIPETELATRLKALKGHSWLDVAGCESGAFDVGFHSATRLFTSSSRGSETSYEYPDRKQSVWVAVTWTEGYRQGLADRTGRAHHATMKQMAAYGVQRATQQTQNQAAGPQHPVSAGGSASWTLSAPPGR